MIVTEQRLRVYAPRRKIVGLVEQRQERSATEVSWIRSLGEVEDRRDDVHQLHQIVHPSSRRFARGLLDDHRHTERFLVQQ
jgi:hypothetical protein